MQSTNDRDDPIPVAIATQVIPTAPFEPSSSTGMAVPSRPSLIREGSVKNLLSQGFTRSLAESLNHTKNEFALRFWVVDNSGSMQTEDGHRIVGGDDKSNVRIVSCSRWEEIRECVEYHIRLASLIEAPTRFRFLNHPGAYVGAQEFSIAEAKTSNRSGNDDLYETQNALKLLRNVRPGGCTPLTQHILEFQHEVSRMAPDLRRTGQKVALILATDGLPTDERGYGGESHKRDFVESLRRLEGLPIWVVIRLCTDEDVVVNFYNELDNLLELSIDVIDDFVGEAKEIYAVNPWLNYSLTLHRLREMGYHDRLFDLIDERALSKSEIRDFSALLLGQENFDGAPDPSVDWNGFAKGVARLLANEAYQYNPILRKGAPLIDMKKLNRIHNPSWFGSFF